MDTTPDIDELRERYDKLAAECTLAVALDDKPAIARLMEEKKQAFAVWFTEKKRQQHIMRDAMRPTDLNAPKEVGL